QLYTQMQQDTKPLLALAPPVQEKTDTKLPTKKNAEQDTETLISATRMNFDQNANIATATGDVEIARSGYVLHADKVIYNQNTGVMHAEGHVAILHPDGEVSFADREEVTGDMKEAFAKN